MRACLVIAFSALCIACELPQGPRTAPFPTFEPHQPFPELGEGAGIRKKPDAKAKAADAFEEAIRRASEGGSTDPKSDNVAVQIVPLSSILVAQMPVEFDEWSYSTDGTVTMITHRLPGSLPDALVYIEAFSPAVEDFPSYEVARFGFTVDPSLTPSNIYPPLLGLAYQWVTGQAEETPTLDMVLAMELATTRTLGLGLGYHATPNTFTGWKWVGKNKHDVALRLGRSTGSWDTPKFPGAKQAERLIKDLLTKVPGLGNLKEQLDGFTTVTRSSTRPPSAAWMIIGSASRKNDLGVHIAILCARRPVCAVSEDLARLLDSIRPPRETDPLATSDGPVTTFAQKAGIGLLEQKDTISAPQMAALLKRMMSKKSAPKPGGGVREVLPKGLESKARELEEKARSLTTPPALPPTP